MGNKLKKSPKLLKVKNILSTRDWYIYELRKEIEKQDFVRDKQEAEEYAEARADEKFGKVDSIKFDFFEREVFEEEIIRICLEQRIVRDIMEAREYAVFLADKKELEYIRKITSKDGNFGLSKGEFIKKILDELAS